MSINYKDYLCKQVFPAQKLIPNCGAYCTAYYLWSTMESLEISKSLNAAGEPTLVAEIYSKIKFGIQIGDMSADFSNPVKIMQYLNSLKTSNLKFVLSNIIMNLKKPVLTNAKCSERDITIIDYDKQPLSYFQNIENGQYLMSLFDTERGIHYVLIKKEDDKFYYCNSWDGIIKSGKDSFDDCVNDVIATEPYLKNSFKFLNAGILI